MKKILQSSRVVLMAALIIIITAFSAYSQDRNTAGEETAVTDDGYPKFGLQASIFRNVRSLILEDQNRDGRPDYTQNFSLMSDYVLTPGDIFLMVVTSGVRADGSISNIQEYELQLSNNYQLNVPFLGTITVKGMNIERLQEYVVNRIRNMVPVQYVNITLLSPAQFNVFIYGGVEQPGYIVGNPLMGVIEAISIAGGFKPGASYRSVRISRTVEGTNQTRTVTTDISRFYQEGDYSANLTLKPEDRIYIPPAEIITSIAGNIHYPGTYELVPGETLRDLLLLAGNVRADTMTSKIEVRRIQPNGEHTLISLPLSMGAEFEIENGDSVTVLSTSVISDMITIEGAIFGRQFNKSGAVQVPQASVRVDLAYYPGISLLGALDEVGGPTPLMSSEEDSYLLRRKSDGTAERRLLDITGLWESRDPSLDVGLKPGDLVLIPIEKLNVFITGQVVNPGAYGYVNGYKVSDYILLAGGIPEETGNKNGIFFMDDQGRKTKAKPKDGVEPGDHLFVEKIGILKADQAVQNALITLGWVSTIAGLASTIVGILVTVGAF